ncbi:hypothetical protein [Flavobacterium sp.]|uniref:hypothetical protein n=1 Tax=Flavobacterium sp. TaxID=239 RepID=UPI002FD90614
MNLKKYHSLFIVLLASIIGLIIHKIIFYWFVPGVFESNFVYSIPSLYVFFGVFALLIVFVLRIVKEKSIDNVGYTFLLLTTLKMAVAYAFLQPILEANLAKTPTEKMSFFSIFIYFLAIETIVTIRILNNKQ